MTSRFEDDRRFVSGVAFRSEIQRLWIDETDFVPFLDYWRPRRITDAGRLPDVFGRVLFTVVGFDHDEREIFEIPEVRKYLQGLVKAWPYFFYADALETPFLFALMQCMVPNLTIVSKTADPLRYASRFGTEDMNRAYRQLLDGLGVLTSMDGTMDQQRFDLRVTAIQEHIRKCRGK